MLPIANPTIHDGTITELSLPQRPFTPPPRGASQDVVRAFRSHVARQFDRLGNIRDTDPDAFAAVVTEIAAKLEARAAEVGPEEGLALSETAAGFAALAQGGTFSSLFTDRREVIGGYGGHPPTRAAEVMAEVAGIIRATLNED